ncbi:MAG: winged helix-turn-helix domain-containing protein [Myxococcota bacterium]
MVDAFRFGPHEVDVRGGELRVHGSPVPLQPLPWRLLLYLIERPGELVSRDELIAMLWPDQIAVSDGSLGQVVRRLRRVLVGDVLHTVPRRGYRFDALPQPVGLRAEVDLVGRDDERASIEAGFRATWLVTLAGPAGVGKTAIARAMTEGGRFVDLSRITDAAGLVRALCHGLDAFTGSGDDPAIVASALQTVRPSILVLDNAEAVIGPLRDLLDALRGAIGDTRVLVTSRVVLGLPGERVVAVEPLPLADARTLLERQLPTGTDEPLDPLLEALDRLPLAIHLCAPRLRLLPPGRLVEALRERFDVLAATPRRDGRHGSLRAALDQSWALLADPERAALGRLVAWSGPFSVAQAEAVLGSGPCLDRLQALRDHSWLAVNAEGQLHILPTLREYAIGQAPDRELHAGFRAHAAFVASAVRSVMDGGPLLAHEDPGLRRLVAMPFDVVDAARRSAELGMEDLAGPCAVAAFHVLVRTGPIPLLRERLEAALPRMLPVDRPLVGRLLADTLVWFEELGRAVEVQREALQGAVRLGHPARVRYHEAGLAMQLYRAGVREEAVELARRVVADAELPPASEASMTSREVLVWDANAQGHSERALALLGDMFRIADTAGLTRVRTRTLRSMGHAHISAGRCRTALGCYEEVLRTVTQQGRMQATVEATFNVGAARAELGDYPRAEAELETAIEVAARRGPKKLLVTAIQHRGWLEIERGSPEASIDWVRRSLEVLHDLPNAAYAVQARGFLAAAYAELGDAGAASAELRLAEPLLGAAGGEWTSEWWTWLAVAQWSGDRFDEVLVSTSRAADGSAQREIVRGCLRAIAHDALGSRKRADEARREVAERSAGTEFAANGWVGRWRDRAGVMDC